MRSKLIRFSVYPVIILSASCIAPSLKPTPQIESITIESITKAEAPVDPKFLQAQRELPPGVPNPFDSGRARMFTTRAFQKEALRLVIQEANLVAQELNLQENLPIVERDVVHSFVGPFGYSYREKCIGNITTKNYWYGVTRNNKFSQLTVADYDNTCLRLKKESWLPLSQMDTNAAYQLATQWLSAVHMDVQKMRRDCELHIAPSSFWNEVPKLGDIPKKKFIPIYYIWWTSEESRKEVPHFFGNVASVELYLPTKKLLQLTVTDPKYILRPQVVFTNLAELLKETNAPAIRSPLEKP